MEYYENFTFFSLVVMRMGGFIYFNPIFGREQGLPTMFKSSLALMLSVIVFSSTEAVNPVSVGIIDYSIMLLKEFMIGYVIGFVMNLFSFVIVSGGELLDMQIGLSMSKVFDAQSNTQISATATLYNAMYMMMFFGTNTHLYIIHLMLHSYKVLPYNEVVFGADMTRGILELFVLCVNLGIKMVFPIIALEFLVLMGMGMLMKTIPQINVFVINFQTKILVGFFLMMAFFTPIAEIISGLLDLMLRNVEIMFGIL